MNKYNEKYMQNLAPITGSVCVACGSKIDTASSIPKGMLTGIELGCCRECANVINSSVSTCIGAEDAIGRELMVDYIQPFTEALVGIEDVYEGSYEYHGEGFDPSLRLDG